MIGEWRMSTSLAATSSPNLSSSLCNLAIPALASSRLSFSPSMSPSFCSANISARDNLHTPPKKNAGAHHIPSSRVAVCSSFCWSLTITECFCRADFCFDILAYKERHSTSCQCLQGNVVLWVLRFCHLCCSWIHPYRVRASYSHLEHPFASLSQLERPDVNPWLWLWLSRLHLRSIQMIRNQNLDEILNSRVTHC